MGVGNSIIGASLQGSPYGTPIFDANAVSLNGPVQMGNWGSHIATSSEEQTPIADFGEYAGYAESADFGQSTGFN